MTPAEVLARRQAMLELLFPPVSPCAVCGLATPHIVSLALPNKRQTLLAPVCTKCQLPADASSEAIDALIAKVTGG